LVFAGYGADSYCNFLFGDWFFSSHWSFGYYEGLFYVSKTVSFQEAREIVADS